MVVVNVGVGTLGMPMTYCTPLDTGPGHLWCQTSVSVGDGGLTWQQMVLTYTVVLLVTWVPLIVGHD